MRQTDGFAGGQGPSAGPHQGVFASSGPQEMGLDLQREAQSCEDADVSSNAMDILHNVRERHACKFMKFLSDSETMIEGHRPCILESQLFVRHGKGLLQALAGCRVASAVASWSTQPCVRHGPCRIGRPLQ